MKNLLVILFIALTTMSNAQVGLGIVKVDLNKVMNGNKLKFYNSENSNTPVKALSFKSSVVGMDIENSDEVRKWLSPEAMYFEYESFFFICTNSGSTRYEVIINKDEGQKYWIEKSRYLVFDTWENFLGDVLSIERKNGQPLKSSPDDNSETINYKGPDCFRLLKMKGDFIKVAPGDACEIERDPDKQLKEGWIRWRKDEELMITYSLVM